VENKKNKREIFWANLKGRDHAGDLGIDERVVSK
jgi:hypothetical protein